MSQKQYYRITEVAQSCQVSEGVILQFIEREWLKLANSESLEFDEEDFARARLIQELIKDLGVNDESVPIILHLLDQLHFLHLHLSQNYFKTNPAESAT